MIRNLKRTLYLCLNDVATLTGNVPGKDASKNDTREFGGAEKQTDEPENNLVLELIWA